MSDQAPPPDPIPSGPYEPYRPSQPTAPEHPAPPSGAAYSPPPVRHRSGVKRLVLGTILTALSAATLLWSIPAIAGGLGADAMIPADGKDHTMELPADSTRGLYLQNTFGAALNCSLRDSGGENIRIRRPGATYTVNSWTAQAVFDTGDGTVVINCAAEPDGFEERHQVRIGPTSGLVVGIVAIFVTIGAGLSLIGALLGVAAGIRRRRALAAPPGQGSPAP